MNHHSSTTEPVTLTARSANKEEHAHLDIHARDIWNAAQDFGLVPRPIVSTIMVRNVEHDGSVYTPGPFYQQTLYTREIQVFCIT